MGTWNHMTTVRVPLTLHRHIRIDSSATNADLGEFYIPSTLCSGQKPTYYRINLHAVRIQNTHAGANGLTGDSALSLVPGGGPTLTPNVTLYQTMLDFTASGYDNRIIPLNSSSLGGCDDLQLDTVYDMILTAPDASSDFLYLEETEGYVEVLYA